MAEELEAAIRRATLRLNSPSAPGQRHTAIRTDDLRMILDALSRKEQANG
jgi:hypothetical protein